MGGLPALRSPVAPIAARIPSLNAGKRGQRANAECGNSIKFTTFMSHLYLGHVSLKKGQYPTSTQVTIIESQIHPSPTTICSGLKIFVSAQCWSHLTRIQVVSPPCILVDSPLLSIQVVSHLILHPYISISHPSWWHLSSIQVHKLLLSSTQAPSQAHPRLKINDSPPSRSAKLHLRFKQPPSQTYPGFRICLNSMQVLSHLNPNSNILASLPPIFQPTSIRVTRFTSHHHPSADTWVSPPSRSRLSSIHLWRFVNQFHPCTI